MMAGSMNVHAQKARNRRMGIKTDSIIQVKDSLVIDSLKLLEERQKIENMEAPVAVSYTHLTLPTNSRV